jgi:hypothetical protein
MWMRFVIWGRQARQRCVTKEPRSVTPELDAARARAANLDKISLNPPKWLSSEIVGEQPVWDQLNPAELLAANLVKMHHQQATSQWIRTWSFALTGFFIGYASVFQESLLIQTFAFLAIELMLIIILLKDVEWHRMFWRYRDRARLCEAYLLGNIDKETMRGEYLAVVEPSRGTLLRDAFSPRKLVSVSTDFMESYLIVSLALGFIAYWGMSLYPLAREALSHGD